jgi:hypothetical protein
MADPQEAGVSFEPATYRTTPETIGDLGEVLGPHVDNGEDLLNALIVHHGIQFDQGGGQAGTFHGLSEKLQATVLGVDPPQCALAGLCSRKLSFNVNSGDVVGSKVSVSCGTFRDSDQATVKSRYEACKANHQRVLEWLGNRVSEDIARLDVANQQLEDARQQVITAEDRVNNILGVPAYRTPE